MPVLTFDSGGSYQKPSTKPRYTASNVGRTNNQLNKTQGSEGLVPKATSPAPAPAATSPTAPSSGGVTGGAPAPGAPATPVAAADAHGHEEAAGVLDTGSLEKILAGIEAQFGLSREQLLTGEGEAANLYRFVIANLAQAKQQAAASSQEGAIRRGVLRSGIAAEEQARISNSFAQQQAQAAADRDAQLSQIALALQQLEADLNREKTNAAVNYADTTLGTQEAIAQALQLV